VAQRASGTKPSLSLEKYAGVYVDSMYGEVRVTLPGETLASGASAVTLSGSDAAQGRASGQRLRITYGSMFDGELEHWHYDTFRATWTARNMGRSFVTFALDSDGKVRALEFEGMGSFTPKK
jgi:Domain of unknown function (DUF3471)